MKTKKLTTALLVSATLMITGVKAQGLFMGVDLGYGFPAAREIVYDSKTSNSGSGSTTEYTAKNLSMGKGINAGVFVGYMFNKNLGAQLGIGYLIGGKTTTESESTNGSVSTKNEYIYKGNMLRFTPALRLTTGEGKLQPYMKIGMIVGVGAKATSETNRTSSNPAGTSTSQEIEVYKGGLSLGFHGGLGVTYSLSDKLGLFGEIAGNFQNWAPKTSEITTESNNGVDLLPSMTTSQKETEYLKDYTTKTTNDPGSPSQSTKFTMPFSSVGINIGVIITMGGGGE